MGLSPVIIAGWPVFGYPDFQTKKNDSADRRLHPKEKPPIFGMIQRGGQVVMWMLANVQQKTIRPIIESVIAPSTMVYTDEYDIYSLFTLKFGLPTPRKSSKNQFDSEHHTDQVLHILSLVGVPLAQNLNVKGQRFRLIDLLRNSKTSSSKHGELSWTISAYSTYKVSGSWKNKYGKKIALPDLVEKLLDTPVTDCGGAHKWYALAKVVREKSVVKTNVDLNSRVLAAIEKEARRLEDSQHKCGALNIAKLPTDSEIVVIHYTGHALEWLGLHLNRQMLRREWILAAVDKLCHDIESAYPDEFVFDFSNEQHCKEFGYLSHALAALKTWKNRTTIGKQIR